MSEKANSAVFPRTREEKNGSAKLQQQKTTTVLHTGGDLESNSILARLPSSHEPEKGMKVRSISEAYIKHK